jgi:hypothetical protein
LDPDSISVSTEAAKHIFVGDLDNGGEPDGGIVRYVDDFRFFKKQSFDF